MLTLARENRWDKVAELEAARRVQIETFFSAPVPVGDSSEVTAAIHQLLRMNDEIAKLGVQARDSIGSEHRVRQLGNKATRAYRRCASKA